MDFLFPRERLSWSLIDAFENRRSTYERKYLFGIPVYATKFISLGRWFADMMETEHRWLLDDRLFSIASRLKRYPDGEEFINSEVRGIPVVIKMDSNEPDLSAFREYKTGKEPWDQDRVNGHGQLLMYASAIRALTGKVPTCGLDWVETELLESGELVFTGRVENFERELSHELLDEWDEYLVEVANRIHIDYQMHLGGEALLLDKPLIQEYVRVSSAARIMAEEKAAMQDDVLNAMDQAGVDRIRTPHGLIYQMKRQVFTYSDYVRELGDELADLEGKLRESALHKRIDRLREKMEAQMQAEQRAGAPFYESRTVVFKPKV